jgi:hypothetical protein
MWKLKFEPRRRFGRVVLGVSAAGGLMLSAGMIGQPNVAQAESPRELAATPPVATPASSKHGFAQIYSTYCETRLEICILDTAQPVGSRCRCNGLEGRVVR